MFFQDIQIKWLLKIQQLSKFISDNVWYEITQIAAVGAFVLGLSLTYHKGPRFIIQAAISCTITLVLVYQIKGWLNFARPLGVIGEANMNVIGPKLYWLSFPSGHTAAAFLLLGIVWQAKLSYKTKFLAALFGLIGGVSRIVTGAHWPQDVLAGAAFSFFSFILVMKMMQALTDKISFFKDIKSLKWTKKALNSYKLLILALILTSLTVFFWSISFRSNLILATLCLTFYVFNLKHSSKLVKA